MVTLSNVIDRTIAIIAVENRLWKQVWNGSCAFLTVQVIVVCSKNDSVKKCQVFGIKQLSHWCVLDKQKYFISNGTI